MPRKSLRPALTRLRSLLAIAMANLIGAAFAFGVAEAAARLAGFQPRGLSRGDRGLWRYEALRGWGLTKGAVGEDYRGGPDRGAVRVNAKGFRGPSFARSKGRDARRILVLGDSFGFGIGVDESHTVSSRLADLVNADKELTHGGRVDVLNLAISGYSTDQEILTFEEVGAPLDPDVVILLMCDNDFEGNMEGFVYRRYYKPRFVLDGEGVRLVDTPVPRPERRRPIRTWLFDHSAVEAAILKRGDWPWLRRISDSLAPGEAAPSTGSPDALMLALLRKLDRDVERTGATLVTFNTGHRGERTKRFQALRPGLERAGILTLGLEGPMNEARKRHPELKWDFGADTHWNVPAHDLAARVIHLHLRKLAREGKVNLSVGTGRPAGR